MLPKGVVHVLVRDGFVYVWSMIKWLKDVNFFNEDEEEKTIPNIFDEVVGGLRVPYKYIYWPIPSIVSSCLTVPA